MSAQIIGFDEACACESPANREVDVPPGDLHPYEIDMDGRIARAYKAGYVVGRLWKDAGAALDPELALARRRGHYAVRGNRQRDRKGA